MMSDEIVRGRDSDDARGKKARQNSAMGHRSESIYGQNCDTAVLLDFMVDTYVYHDRSRQVHEHS